MKRVTVHVDPFAQLRRLSRDASVADLRDGRRNRAVSFRAKKGRGSYSRTTKHKEF